MAMLDLILLEQVQTVIARPDFAPLWETMKGVMLTLSTGAILWTAKTVFNVRDDVRTITHELFGRDGTNGMKSVMTDNKRRLDLIDARHVALDAVAQAERDLYDGEEQRHSSRRLSDRLKDRHA